MKRKQKNTRALQWHPAFYACARIEFSEEAEEFYFNNEYQLGTKPKEIDVLIIKRNPDRKIQKNIGRIFRRHNIIEYKSPTDYLGIDDYYKVYGYACFYKADTGKEDAVKASDITISFVCFHYPYKLVKHLREQRRLYVEKQEAGIYYIIGDMFPIQLIVTSRLSPKKNLWLCCLTNSLRQGEMDRLIKEYGKHYNDNLYKSAMNLIVHANQDMFEEGKEMCDALMELFKDELETARRTGHQIGRREGRQKGLMEGRLEGRLEGHQRGLMEGRLEGQKEGRMEGIFAMIADNLEEGFSVGRITQKLEKRFGLTEKEAQEYMEKYEAVHSEFLPKVDFREQ